MFVKLGSYPVRQCAPAKGTGVVVSLAQGSLTYAQVRYEENIEESVTTVKCAVRISEVNNEQEKVRHGNGALFRTPKIGLLPYKSRYFCKQQY